MALRTIAANMGNLQVSGIPWSQFKRHWHGIARALQNWLFHGTATDLHWSHSSGYHLAMHSKPPGRCRRGMPTSERKWNAYNQSLISRYGSVNR